MPLTANKAKFQEAVNDAVDHYGISRQLIVSDYWLVRTLHAWATRVGYEALPRRYPDPSLPKSDQSVGRIVFGGGTSLSAAWGITHRWSQDIDFVLDSSGKAPPRQLRHACKKAFEETSAQLGTTYRATEDTPSHCFAVFNEHDRDLRSSIDVAFHPLDNPTLWTQERPVMSLIGRMQNESTLEAYPELGGFDFATLGPGTTAMNKLLAQTEVCRSGNLALISERARDVYDLARIAIARDQFEGHIGRDSKALLHIAEGWIPSSDRKRPTNGFASLASFDASTSEYRALADGYETVMNEMVWGDPIPLDEAIILAVSLDPGPPEPPPPLNPSPYVAYPRR